MRLSEYMAEEETSLVTFHLCILQHHPWGWVGSQRAVPGDQFQISSQCFGQGYDLNINPSMLAGYGRYEGGGVSGGRRGEKPCWHMCKLCKERTNKHAGIRSMGLPAKSVLPLNPFYWDTVNESAVRAGTTKTHRLMQSKSVFVWACFLWQTRIKQRKGDNRRHVKVMLKKKKTVIQAERE